MRLVPSPVNPAWLIPEGWEPILGARMNYRIGNSTLRLLRVQLNQHANLADATESHAHRHHQLLFYQQGHGIERVDGTEHAVAAGSIFFIPAGHLHSFSSSSDTPVICLAIDFEVAEVEPIPLEDALGGDEVGVLFSLLHTDSVKPFHLRASDQQRVQQCIAEILDENERRETGFSALIQASLLKLIALCLRATQRAEGFDLHFRHTAWRHQLIADRAMALVKSSALDAEPPSLSAAARLCASSPNHLNRVLKKLIGKTYVQLLLQQRLEHARRLLEGGKHNCTEAAFESGFEDSNYFARMFRKTFGAPPTAFLPRGESKTSRKRSA